MKAVLIAINPKWCELIASGEKTIEVRKSRPKIETPFKCYIYCTQGKGLTETLMSADRCHVLNGYVIGEFLCDRIDKQLVFHRGITRIMVQGYKEKLTALCKGAALSLDELHDYIDKDGKDLELAYGWHISDLKIYDTPKELYEFKKAIDCEEGEHCFGCTHALLFKNAGCRLKALTRPPQSWRYVENQTYAGINTFKSM